MELLDKVGFYFWVILVGFIGGILDYIDSGSKKKATSVIVGIATSMFLGWIGFEMANFFIKDTRASLAICGFLAWRGTEWIKETVDRAINSKLNRHDEYFDKFEERDNYEDQDK